MDQGQVPPAEMRQGPKRGGAGIVGVKDMGRGRKQTKQRGQIQGMIITPAGQRRNRQPKLKGRIKNGRALGRGHAHTHPGLMLLRGKIYDLTLTTTIFTSKIQMRHSRGPRQRLLSVRHLNSHARRSG
jgi:hypothetical protein